MPNEDRDAGVSATEIAFFPEWGRAWPLWGVGRRGLPGISEELTRRLRAWCRIWQEELNPVSEVKWPDADRGRAWIEEGYELVREVQEVVRPLGMRVVPDFQMYAPESTETN